MLSPNDIHYIVGLITVAAESDQLFEFELGSQVFDSVGETNRDIDITFSYRNADGELTTLKGWEVKNHHRPLTIEQIEQLIQKFEDIPSITHRGIVSASGYSEAAIKKAQRYKIDLFYLEAWKPSSYNIASINFENELIINTDFYLWIRPFPLFKVAFISPQPSPEFNLDTPLFDDEGPHEFPTMGLLFKHLEDKIVQEFRDKPELSSYLVTMDDKKPKVFEEKFVPSRDIYIGTSKQKWFIDHITLAGSLTRLQEQIKPEFKVLRKHGETMPFIGCAIADSEIGLIGASINNNNDGRLNFFHVTVEERIKNKINQLKFTR